jgi:putative acetyltransferase
MRSRGGTDDAYGAPVSTLSGVRLVPERDEHHADVRRVVLAAFAHHPSVADLVELVRASPEYLPDLALVALADEAVVGHVMVSRASLVEEDGTRHEVLTLSPLAVAPSHQGRGVGGLLVRSVLTRAESTGEPLVTLEGSPRYYPRFGFRPAADLGVSITLPEWAPPEAAMAYPLPGHRPEVRGHLEYPPAFAQID